MSDVFWAPQLLTLRLIVDRITAFQLESGDDLQCIAVADLARIIEHE